MKSYQVPEPGKPLVEVESPTPEPTGSQVIVKTIACGVCHSDVHIHSGAFDLGGGNELPVPVPNPFTLGHEVFGEVLMREVQRDHWEGSKPPRVTPRSCADRTSDRGQVGRSARSVGPVRIRDFGARGTRLILSWFSISVAGCPIQVQCWGVESSFTSKY